MELCELAAQEKDPKKLMALIGEIDRLLEAKHQCVAKAPDLVAENPADKASKRSATVRYSTHGIVRTRGVRYFSITVRSVNPGGHGLASGLSFDIQTLTTAFCLLRIALHALSRPGTLTVPAFLFLRIPLFGHRRRRV